MSLPSAAVQIAAGPSSSYVMLVDGSIWAWGSNGFGQLGDGTSVNSNSRVLSPVQIEGYGSDTTSADQAACVSCGTWSDEVCSDGVSITQNSCLIAGEIWTAGSCSKTASVDQAACESNCETWSTAACLDGARSGAMRLPAGGAVGQHMFVVTADGTAKGSGRNYNGQLGNGESGSGFERNLIAEAIPELGVDIVEIARGGQHTLLLKGE